MNEKKIYKIAKLDPSISSENVGDHIILQYCDSILQDIFGDALVVGVPTREKLSYNTRMHIATSDYAIVCGTNLLSSNMNRYRQWNVSLGDVRKILQVNLEKADYFSRLKKSE